MVAPVRTGLANTNGIQIAYEDMGDVDAPPILLIMGFSAQLTAWPAEFCETLLDAGFRVIRFDNRDIGLSTKLSGVRVRGNELMRVARYWTTGRPSDVPYTLHDMAADAIGLLDHLGIASAHVVGASMGGMIAQILADTYADRVSSLGLIFTSTNEPFLPPPSIQCMQGLFGGPGKDATREERIDFSVKFMRSTNGRRFRIADPDFYQEAEATYDRSYYPAGIIRQLSATIGTGSLVKHTRRISCPTVILHGTDDGLVRSQGSKAIAKRIPHARLHLIDGWGHNFPRELIPQITGHLLANIRG